MRTPFIVVAEDDDEMRRLLCRALDRDGCHVLAVGDGMSLWTALEAAWAVEREPDLLVTDVRMPHASGLEVVERLRQRGSRTRVILISAFADEPTFRRAGAVGVAHVLSKPFDLDVLRVAAGNLLGR